MAMRFSPTLRIAIVTESFLPEINGVTNSVLRVLEEAARLGHQVMVIAPESQSGDAPDEYAGFPIKRVPSLTVKGMLPLGLPQRRIEPLIEGFNPDVIHLASPFFLGYYVAKIAERLSIPTVSIYQTDVAGFARHYGMTLAHGSITKWIAKIHIRTTRTLAPSSWSCEALAESGVENVHLWQRGINSERFNPSKRSEDLRNELRRGSSKTLVGYVGRLANEKRLEDLKVLDSRQDLQLVLVGDGPARAKLERELPNAIFVGYQSGDALATYYASFDIFVHTGRDETFCQSIQEALASGIPVVAPNSGGPLDLIAHGKTGFLIDTTDAAALDRSVSALIAMGDLAQTTRGSVISRTWPKVIAELFAHYNEVIAAMNTSSEKQAELVA